MNKVSLQQVVRLGAGSSVAARDDRRHQNKHWRQLKSHAQWFWVISATAGEEMKKNPVNETAKTEQRVRLSVSNSNALVLGLV